MQRRRDIDGLRALAILPVVFYHAGVPGFDGGFVGVDVFFVISGFLITGILYEELGQGHFSISRFYERRIRRIFPALFLMLLVVIAVGAFVLLPYQIIALGRSVLATTLFISNHFFWSQGDYFDPDQATLPLLHTWSLAVEEQFYIFFPPLLWLVHRWRPSWLAGVVIALLVSSFAVSIVGVALSPRAAFYFLPTRAWELMIGATLAVLPTKQHSSAVRQAIGILGIVGVLAPVFLFTEATPFPGLAALPPCLGAAAIIYAGVGTGASRVLSQPVLVGIGLISYSLYLWHWPLLAFLHELEGPTPSTTSRVLAVASAFALAGLTWVAIEQPVRRIRTGRKLLVLGCACLLAGLSVGLLIQAKGLPNRWPPAALMIVEESQRELKLQEKSYHCTQYLFGDRANFGPCPIGVEGPTRLIVFGDSHAMALKDALDAVLKEQGIAGSLVAVAGCSPAFELDRVNYSTPCAERMSQISRYIESTRPVAVLIVGAWRGALLAKVTVYRGRRSDDDESRLINVTRAISETVSTLNTRGIHVGFALPVPGGRSNVPNSLARGWGGIEWSTTEHVAFFAPLRAAAQKSGAQLVIDFSDAFCDDRRCAVHDANGVFYMDASHVNIHGAEQMMSLLRKTVSTLLARPQQG